MSFGKFANFSALTDLFCILTILNSLFSPGLGGGQNLEIFCNNNNSDQDDPNKISPLSRVNSNDDIPAVKFLGVFFTPILISNITLQC